MRPLAQAQAVLLDELLHHNRDGLIESLLDHVKQSPTGCLLSCHCQRWANELATTESLLVWLADADAGDKVTGSKID